MDNPEIIWQPSNESKKSSNLSRFIEFANQQCYAFKSVISNVSLSNVGIGTTNPTSNLTVDGNQNVTGNLFLDNHMTSNLGIRTDAVYTDSRDIFRVDVTTNGTVSAGSTIVTGINTACLLYTSPSPRD